MTGFELTTLFVLLIDCVKNLILSEAASKGVLQNKSFPLQRRKFQFVKFQVTTMWTILDAAAFLDPHLAFTYKENDSYFNFQCYFCLQSFHLFLNENAREPFCE